MRIEPVPIIATELLLRTRRSVRIETIALVATSRRRLSAAVRVNARPVIDVRCKQATQQKKQNRAQHARNVGPDRAHAKTRHRVVAASNRNGYAHGAR